MKHLLKSALLTAIFGCLFLSSFSQSKETRENIQKLATVMQLIDYAYVDPVEIQDVVDNAIAETLKDLDPHSAYIPKKELERSEEQLEGSFEGIGVTFQIFRDTILVISPVPGGPSEKLGIMAGDKIVRINGEKAHGPDITNKFVMDKLRGEKGSKVDVSIYRQGRKELIEYTIVRDEIPIHSIDATFMLTPEIGYIKLNRFSKNAMEEFRDGISSLKQQGMEKLILDLRGNSGGYLGIAVELADEFLPEGRMIVYTKGHKSPREEFDATQKGSFEQGPLVIMIDEGSASASEIVSGAVQDWDRGLILGRRSFGKGLVQRPFPLTDGSVLRLTTARYHTPTGRSIQRPYNKGYEEYYKDFLERWEMGEMVHADSIHFPDSLKYYTPGNRVVYGGGGIMPDIFIPWDSTWISDYYIDLRKNGVLNQFTVKYVNDNRTEILDKYPEFEDYKQDFNVSDEILQEFFEIAEKEGVEYDEEGFEKSGRVLRSQIKAWMARNLWDVGASYAVFSETDDALQKAIEILSDGSLFLELKIHP